MPGSLINGIQSTNSFKTFFGNPVNARLGLITASQAMGSVLILPVVGILSDRIGRKLTLLIGIVVVIVASIIQAAAVNYAMLVVSRVIVGIGGMLVTQPSPMLISEVKRTK
jgi:MFS family permease